MWCMSLSEGKCLILALTGKEGALVQVTLKSVA